jgi:hypothetical protein
MGMFCAAPAIALPTAKKRMDKSMIGLRPKISASFPERGRKAVLDSAYAEPTQTKLLPPLRSAVMVGRAVPTAVKSSALRKMDTRIAPNDNQKALPFPGFFPASGSFLEGGDSEDMERGKVQQYHPQCIEYKSLASPGHAYKYWPVGREDRTEHN